MIEKYNEELGAVDEENITAEDVSKFSLNESTNGLNFWGQFRQNPHWRKIEQQISEETRQQMLEEHPDYKTLLAADEEGGLKKVYKLEGPWMKPGYDNGLHGHYDGWNIRKAHHH